MAAPSSASRALRIAASLLPVCVFLAVYVPRVGHGFILDDYGWIFDSRVAQLSDLPNLFVKNSGFYRPVVSLTFAIDYALFGLQPLWYGLTNVALAVLCAALIYLVSRVLGLPWGAAAFAGSLWLLNFHGINMAVLWISGRTSLLLTAAALAAAACVVRRRLVLASVFLAIALLSKEEAVALPLILGGWIYLLNRDDPDHRCRRMLQLWAACSLVLLAAYLGLRSQSGAMTPATAPHYYRFTFEPWAIGRNLLEYADRALTLPILATIASWLLLSRRGLGAEDDGEPVRRDVLLAGVLWILGGYCITLFLPVRSSLYVCLPSVGACLIAAEICRFLWSRAPERRGAALTAAIVLTVLAAPIHYTRTRRLVEQAELSDRVWKDLPRLTQAVPDGADVVIYDDMTRRANVRSSLGSLLNPAYELRTGRQLKFWIEPPEPGAGDAAPCPACVAQTLVLRNGSLTVAENR